MWYNDHHTPTLTLPLCRGNLATPHPLISRVFPRLPGQSPGDGLQVQQGSGASGLLAVEADRPHWREALAGLLWPDRPDRDALSNLRYSLASLRRTIGDRTAAPPFLLVTPNTIQFNRASDYWLDVAEIDDRSSTYALTAWRMRTSTV